MYNIRKILPLFCFCLLIVSFNSCKKVEPQTVINEGEMGDSGGVTMPSNGLLHNKLSDYRFFVGDLKDQIPTSTVLPYDVISPLFTDYALKKRFIWMPMGVKANYDGAGEILDFPVGTVLIKTFYYNHVQPNDVTRILETRLMINTSSGWIFAEYLWNDEQTEAYLEMGSGQNIPISWNHNGEVMSTTYRIPSETECKVCHKLNDNPIPIGVKPQHLNKNYSYEAGEMNQLQKWKEFGILASYPSSITSLVDYTDVSKSLNLRLRSYLDINCAHCHSENKHCDYRAIRFAFSETNTKYNMGLCQEPGEFVPELSAMDKIISPANIARSAMHARLNTTDPTYRMPLLGRTIIHREAVELLEQWINAHPDCE